MRRGGMYCVEVQKTRTGERDGEQTRPYRFTDFDLLAVCMWASTGDWHSFMYAPLVALRPRREDNNLVQIMQAVPEHPGEQNDPVWTSDLNTALTRLGQ